MENLKNFKDDDLFRVEKRNGCTIAQHPLQNIIKPVSIDSSRQAESNGTTPSLRKCLQVEIQAPEYRKSAGGPSSVFTVTILEICCYYYIFLLVHIKKGS